jgi:hypothetical protein
VGILLILVGLSVSMIGQKLYIPLVFVLGLVISSFYFTTILYTQFISVSVQTWVLNIAAVFTVLACLMTGILFAKIK